MRMQMQFQPHHANYYVTMCNNTCGSYHVCLLARWTTQTCCCFLITSRSFLSTSFHYFRSLQLQSRCINWKRANRRGFTIGELCAEESPEWRNETGACCTSKGRRWSHWQMCFSQTCIGMFFPTVVIVWGEKRKKKRTLTTTRRWKMRAAGSSRPETAVMGQTKRTRRRYGDKQKVKRKERIGWERPFGEKRRGGRLTVEGRHWLMVTFFWSAQGWMINAVACGGRARQR